MQATPLLRTILLDEAITRGLGDAEARMLIEWLVDWAEVLAVDSDTEDTAWSGLRIVTRRARGIARFMILWAEPESRGAAAQLAASERFWWPLPTEDEDPLELLQRILTWEDRQFVV